VQILYQCTLFGETGKMNRRERREQREGRGCARKSGRGQQEGAKEAKISQAEWSGHEKSHAELVFQPEIPAGARRGGRNEPRIGADDADLAQGTERREGSEGKAGGIVGLAGGVGSPGERRMGDSSLVAVHLLEVRVQRFFAGSAPYFLNLFARELPFAPHGPDKRPFMLSKQLF
jgi:hypothetical protein